jgi:hypothetical protein
MAIAFQLCSNIPTGMSKKIRMGLELNRTHMFLVYADVNV